MSKPIAITFGVIGILVLALGAVWISAQAVNEEGQEGSSILAKAHSIVGGSGTEVPSGTALKVRLQQGVSSATVSETDPVTAVLVDPVHVEDAVALPAGTLIRGRVASVEPAGRVKGNGYVKLAFHELELPNGKKTTMSANWEAKAEPPRKRDTAIVGGSAAGGALLGQVLGGDTESTVKGTVVGGAIGTGIVLSNKGREVELASGQELLIELRNDVKVPR